MTDVLTVEQMDRLVAGQATAIRDAFLLAPASLGAGDLAALAALLEAGRIEEAVLELERAAAALGASYGQALISAANAAAAALSGALVVNVVFDASRDLPVEAMRRNGLRLVQSVTTEQRQAASLVLQDGIARGLNPLDQARELRDVVGLHPRQVSAVQNYRRLLESGDAAALQRALRDRRFDPSVLRLTRGEALPPGRIDAMVRAYARRMLAHRATMIARTEALASVHEGTQALYAQAVQDGVVAQDELVDIWWTARDERVRGSHAAIHDTRRPQVDGLWNGVLRFPGDPGAPAGERINCRCRLITRVAELLDSRAA